MITRLHLDHGRVIAWLAFTTGITVSVAANVLHADVAGDATSAELAGAAFWPLALMLAVEVLTRITWPAGWQWSLARFGGVGLVGGVAAILSYRHMAGLLSTWGEDQWNAHLGPLAVDGLMLISATALLAISHGNTVNVPAQVDSEQPPASVPEPVPEPQPVDDGSRVQDEPTDPVPVPDPAPAPAPAPERVLHIAKTPSPATVGAKPAQLAAPADPKERARQEWLKAPADAKPTGGALARKYGADPSSGRRWVREFKAADATRESKVPSRA